jgi:hypothetical protein
MPDHRRYLVTEATGNTGAQVLSPTESDGPDTSSPGPAMGAWDSSTPPTSLRDFLTAHVALLTRDSAKMDV